MATVRMFFTQEEMDATYGAGKYPLGLAPEMRACFGTIVSEGEVQPDSTPIKFRYRGFNWLFSSLKTIDSAEAERIIEAEKNRVDSVVDVLTKVKFEWSTSAGRSVHTLLSYNVKFTTICEPTGNCQLFCIGHFKNLFTYLKTTEVKIILQAISRKYDKRLMLFDINQNYREKLKDFNVKFCSDYTSTNGTPMMSGIIQVR